MVAQSTWWFNRATLAVEIASMLVTRVSIYVDVCTPTHPQHILSYYAIDDVTKRSLTGSRGGTVDAAVQSRNTHFVCLMRVWCVQRAVDVMHVWCVQHIFDVLTCASDMLNTHLMC